MQTQHRRDGRSLGDLFGDLTRETSDLVRQEVALAKSEMTEKATHVGKDVGFVAAGGAVAYAGFLTLIAAVIVLLADVFDLPVWAPALGMGIIVAAIGYFLVRKGLDALKQEDLAPRQTLRSVQEDVAWAKEQVQ